MTYCHAYTILDTVTKDQVDTKLEEIKSQHKTPEAVRREYYRWRATHDLFWFGNDFLGLGKNIDPLNGRPFVDPTLHGDLCDLLERDQNMLILLPRNHCKSTWTAVKAAQELLADPIGCRTLLISVSDDIAKARLRYIISLLCHKNVLTYFDDIIPEPGKGLTNWNTHNVYQLTVVKHPDRNLPEHQITAYGFNSLITGSHFTHIIADDLINEAHVTTPEKRAKAAGRITQLDSIRTPTGRFTFIGTRYHDDDVYARIMQAAICPVKVERQATERPEDKLSLPVPKDVAVGSLDDPHSECIYSYFDKNMLFAKRKRDFITTGSDHDFYLQYYNDPTPLSEAIFPLPIRRYQTLPEEYAYKRYIGVDTTNTDGPVSDLSAIVVGYTDGKHVWIEDAWNKKATWEEIAEALLDMAIKHRPEAVAVETTFESNFRIVYDFVLRRKVQFWRTTDKQRKFPTLPNPRVIKPQRYSARKEQRVNSSFGARYRMQLCTPNGRLTQLLHEMERFPAGKHDDLVDAVAIMLEYAIPKHFQVATPEQEERALRMPGLRELLGLADPLAPPAYSYGENFRKPA